MVVAELSVIPLGKEVSISKYVKAVLEALKSADVKYEAGAMSTTIEAKNLVELFDVVARAHEAVFRMGAKRVVTTLKIDDRRDKVMSITSKLGAIR
ncbi:MAG TPA: MTH1187 family thiamine-binding protein [Methanocellales archaeon]|nr:MTH1187 family thiamine-binding protein [Methanocellales archaeon]